ncbi:MAG TPA: DinB family protein [Vicinamibacteria bacterium]|nr:DinB family protein [Vicinamibacteria bacterium]
MSEGGKTATATEAWLRGPVEGVDPHLMPAAHALIQAGEELRRATAGLGADALRARPGQAASLAFHLRHVAGSIDRLLTYARGETLSPEQRQAAAAESDDTGAPDLFAMIAAVDASVQRALAQIRATPVSTLLEPRAVGRAALPSSVLGLLFHLAEHAQRHAGQAIATAKVVRAGTS